MYADWPIGSCTSSVLSSQPVGAESMRARFGDRKPAVMMCVIVIVVAVGFQKEKQRPQTPLVLSSLRDTRSQESYLHAEDIKNGTA